MLALELPSCFKLLSVGTHICVGILCISEIRCMSISYFRIRMYSTIVTFYLSILYSIFRTFRTRIQEYTDVCTLVFNRWGREGMVHNINMCFHSHMKNVRIMKNIMLAIQTKYNIYTHTYTNGKEVC